MKNSSPVVWLFPLLLLVLASLFSAAMRSADGAGAAEGESPGGMESLVAEVARHPEFSFGFRSLLADVTWLQAVQVSGNRRMRPSDYDRLDRLIGTINRLDPLFDVPYLLGGIILADSPRHALPAIAVLDRGIAVFPHDWRLPFHKGYIAYFSLGDPLRGGGYLRDASTRPGCPPYVPLLAARMMVEGRDPETGLAFLRMMLEQERDPLRREALERRGREVVVERDIQRLEKAAAAYRDRTGRFPAGLEDLVRAGLLPRLPNEPHGGRYVLGDDGSVRSDRIARRLRVYRKNG